MRPKGEAEVGALDRLVGIEKRQGIKKHILYTLVSFQVPCGWDGGSGGQGESQRGHQSPKGGRELLLS